MIEVNLVESIVGRWKAAHSLAQFVRYFENWDEVWAAYRRGGTGALPPLRFRGGLTLHHGPADDPIRLFRDIFVPRSYTRGGFYRPRPNDIVVDLGANIGLFALFLQWCAPGVRVHCFEPGAYALDLLRKNVALNGLESLVTIHPYAVSDRSGVVWLGDATLSVARELRSATDDESDPGEKVQTVDLGRALELCGSGRVDLLKMDIEGSEYEVVCSAQPQAWEPVDRVAVEFHEYIHPDCQQVIAARFHEAGFNSIRVVSYWSEARFGILHAERS
jgi:FkbM family methyltransferase